ncbi:hypothetical protein [Pseudomonas songnenensis]|uniref:Uncharacterized protein n=1 Tax=Pseudomonas songnenensis TaxID=1176259 RepID=A0A482TZD4_9PSED|nr:hypothetical protein [Pseudomonas songnenensis]RYJ59194.1 hypothetical protein EJA06_022045 [Pseudomonas songnenensis]
MYLTKYGLFDGNSWEALLQLIYKTNHRADGYQEMPASPGDFGIEGYVGKTGVAFQCYCPDNNCNQDDLYDKQRGKITRDLGKLAQYEAEIRSRLGGALIKEWVFITPEVNRNKLLRHAKIKEAEVRSWNLSILSPDFTILLHDADFYSREIQEQKSLQGEAIYMEGISLSLPNLDGDLTEYEEHILRKSKLRVAASLGIDEINMSDEKQRAKVQRLYSKTLEIFLDFGRFRNQLDTISPILFHKVERILGTFQGEVDEWRDTLSASPDELTEKVKGDLRMRLEAELKTHIDYTLSTQIVNHAVANWLGLCQLDYE